MAITFALAIFFLRNPLLALYGIKASAAGTLEQIAYNTAIARMSFIFIPYVVISLMEVGCGIVRGLGKAISSTIISLLGACAFRVLWILLVLNNFPSLEVIYVSYPISWVMTGAVFFIYSMTVLRREIRKESIAD